MTSIPALKSYHTLDVMAESPGRRIIKLYNHLAVMLRRSEENLRSNQFELAATHLTKASMTVEELLGALNFEEGGEIADQLGGIYTYMLRELLKIGVTRDPEPLAHLQRMTVSLLEAWVQAVDEQETLNGRR